jgi:hypothetical protein
MWERNSNQQKVFSNHEVVTLAVYLLGGESRYIDPEDVAVKANEIAPGRFTWRKYRDQINIDTVRKRLWDAKKPEKGGYLLGSEMKGWLLTENGLKFARKRIRDLKGADLSREPLKPKERQWLRTERARMLASEAFSKFQAGGVNAVTHQEAETFFRVDDYVVGKAREHKIVRTLNMFGDDPDLGQAVKELASKVRDR